MSMDSSKVISFAGKGLKWDTAADAQPVVDAINACPALETLNLEGNTLGIEAAAAIGKALASRSHFKRALFKDLFTGRLKTEIPDALVHLCSNGILAAGARLEELDMSDNAFGPIGMIALVDFLKSDSCKTLKALRLNNNGLGQQGGKLLAEAIPAMTGLKIFICGRNRQEDGASACIGRALTKIRTLEVIEMPQNGIRSRGIESLAEGIKSNNLTIRVINLNDNIMTGGAAQIMADALATTKQLEEINFGDCLLKRRGAISILNALNNSPCLKTLRRVILNGNEIGGDEVIDTLRECIVSANMDSLSDLRLDLSENNFGERGIEHLHNQLSDLVGELVLDDDGGSEDEEEDDDENQQGDEVEEEEEEDEETDEDGVEVVAEESPRKEFSNGFSAACPAASPVRLPQPSREDLSEAKQLISKENVSIDELCEKFVDISMRAFHPSSETLDEEARSVADAILKSVLARDPNEFVAVNSILISLGLLKREEDRKKKLVDSALIGGPLSVLADCVTSLSPRQKETLKLFIERNGNSGLISGDLKRTLFS